MCLIPLVLVSAQGQRYTAGQNICNAVDGLRSILQQTERYVILVKVWKGFVIEVFITEGGFVPCVIEMFKWAGLVLKWGMELCSLSSDTFLHLNILKWHLAYSQLRPSTDTRLTDPISSVLGNHCNFLNKSDWYSYRLFRKSIFLSLPPPPPSLKEMSFQADFKIPTGLFE